MTGDFPIPARPEPRLDVGRRPGIRRPFGVIWAPPALADVSLTDLRNGGAVLLTEIAPAEDVVGLAGANIIPAILAAGGAVIEAFEELEPALRTMRLFEGGR